MNENATAHKPELPHGAFSQIARRLRPAVTPNHVRLVFKGQRTSPRVERAIQTYIRRLERKQENAA